jgi:hypothetical protein
MNDERTTEMAPAHRRPAVLSRGESDLAGARVHSRRRPWCAARSGEPFRRY